MLAYTRYVLDAGMRGDLLTLMGALAPCVVG
jgi:thiaminase/transcriptional activator TenA